MSFPITLLLADQSGGASPAAPSLLGPGWLIGIVVIFVVMMVLPARKDRKRREAMLAGVKKHDRVLLNCGLYGTVAAVDEQTITVKADDDTRLKFARSAIAGILTGDADDRKTVAAIAEDSKSSGAAPRS